MNKLFFLIIFTCMTTRAFALTDLLKTDIAFYRKLLSTAESKIKIGDFERINGIITDDSKIIALKDHQFLQNFMDEAIARIMLNEMGLNFCMFYSADAEVIGNQTGASGTMAKYLAQECSRRLIKEYGSTQPLGKFPRLKMGKRFYFVIGMNEDVPLESWTTMFNETFFFLKKPEQMINLYRRIIHELYIPYDHKLTLGKGTFNTVEDQNYKVKNNNLFNIGAKDDLEELLGIIPFPLIKFTFSITRAIVFEDQMLSSLFKEEGRDLPKDYYYFTSQDCWDNFEKLGNTLFPYQDIFMPVSEFLLSKLSPYSLVDELYLNENGITQVAKYAKEKEIYLYDKELKRDIDFCQYMSTPLMSAMGSFFSRGPRPRLGSGWGGSSSYSMSDDQSYDDFNDLFQNSTKLKDMSTYPTVKPTDIINELIRQAQKRQTESGMIVTPVGGEEK